MQIAPYVQASAGMRENSVRVGSDVILGSSLEARTWNADPATGILTPGGARSRNGFNWLAWVGGDVGYIASDALLDGGFDGSGPSVDREALSARARAGIVLEYGNFALGYSVTWLSPEFSTQPTGQVIGAIQLRFGL